MSSHGGSRTNSARESSPQPYCGSGVHYELLKTGHLPVTGSGYITEVEGNGGGIGVERSSAPEIRLPPKVSSKSDQNCQSWHLGWFLGERGEWAGRDKHGPDTPCVPF